MTRRRTAAAFAALTAIIATLVWAGAIAASADGGLEFTSPADGAVLPATTSPITLTGTTTNTDYTYPVDVWDFTSGSPDPLCVGMDPSTGSWSCEVTLSPGLKDIRALQVESSDILLFELRLPTPVVTGPDVVPAAGTVSLTGVSGYVGASIYAEVTDPAVPALNCTASVVTDGSWACDIPFDAELTPDTDVTVTLTQSYGAAVSPSATHTFHVAAEPPLSVTIDTPTDGSAYTWDAGTFATVNGRAPLGNPVSVLIDGSPIAACTGLTVDTFGQWDCGSLNLSPGAHTIAAQQIVGETPVTDTAVVDVEVPAPDVAGLPLFAEQNDTYYSVGGTYGLDGYIVEVLLDGESGCDSWVYFGNWSCGLNLSGFGLGDHTLAVRQVPLNPDVIVTSQTADHTFTIQPPGSAPTLNCAFSPDGGFTASSPQQLETLSIYQLFAAGESSKGGGQLGFQGYCNGSAGTTFPEGTEFSYDYIASCGEVCDPATVSVASLPPGDYEVYHRLSDGAQTPGASYESHSYVFTIPEAPTIATAASTTNSVILSGAATPGDAIRIVRDNNTNLCTTTANGAGAWACAFPKSSASTARAIAINPASGGMSAYSSSRNIPIFVASTPAAIPESLPTLPTLVTWFLEFGGDLSNLKPGDTFTLYVSGMPEGTEMEVWMHSTPRLLGTATGTGAPMQLELTVPEDIESGAHEIEMVAVTPLGTNYFFTSDATVVGGVDPTEVPEESVDDNEGASGGSGSVDRSDPAAPSALTGSIAPVAQIVDNPVTIAIAGGLALALLFLVALPTELLNSSLSSNTSRLGRVYGTIDGALTKAQDWLIRFTHSRAIAAGLLVVLIAVIYGFVDPGFGFDIVSLRLVLSLGIAFFLLSFVASWISGLIIRRAWGAIGVIAMQPTIILFAVVGVIVARILEFSPGFLVGVAIGLELLQASKQVSARAVFVQIGVVTGLALAAWVVYSVFTPGNDFVGMLVDDTMVAVTAEGLTGALIAVFPLKFLDGRELWEVSKRLWVGAFLLVAVAFALLVLPTAIEGTDVGDYGVWLLVFGVFGGLSLTVWLIFVRADKRTAPVEREDVDA